MLFDEPQRLRGLSKGDARLGCGGIVEDVREHGRVRVELVLHYRMLSDWGKEPSRLLFLSNRYYCREFAASLRFLRREWTALISGVLEGLSS
jgi:hypothetical protein